MSHPRFEDSIHASKLYAEFPEENISGIKEISHPSSDKNKKNISKISRCRIKFDLKRYLRGIGAFHLLELQRKRREPLLHTAVKEMRQDVVEVLIGRGADPNIRDFRGTTPLHEAAARGHTQILKVLLKYGADASSETPMGETPLLLASLAGHDDAANLLLSAGAEECFEGQHFKNFDNQRSL